MTKKMELANNTTFAVGLIDTKAFVAIADKETKAAALRFATAFNTEDAARGAQAFYMNQIHKRIASGETIEKASDDRKPIKNIADFAERYFGIGRSQAFNLSRAGAMLKVEHDENGKIRYTDIFTNDFDTPNFSNTVLIRFAEFIGDTNSNKAEEKQAAIGRLSYIGGLVKAGEIKPEMSVSRIMDIVRNKDAGETTGKEADSKTDSKTDSKGKASGKKSEKTIDFSLTEKNATDLKNEIIKAIGGKTKEYPILARLAEELYKELNPSKK